MTSRARSRRRFLAVSAVSATLGALAGALSWLRVHDAGRDAALGARLVALAPWEHELVRHLARRLVAPDVDAEVPLPSTDAVGVADFVDRWIARMRPSMRRDLGRLFRYVEHVAPLAIGHARPFTTLDEASQDRALAALAASPLGDLRAGFEGLKALVAMGYWRDPRTWPAIGYPGPIVGPAKGEGE